MVELLWNFPRVTYKYPWLPREKHNVELPCVNSLGVILLWARVSKEITQDKIIQGKLPQVKSLRYV